MQENIEAKKSLYEGFAYQTRELARFFGPFPTEFLHTKPSPLGKYSSIGQKIANDLAYSVEKDIGDGSIRTLLLCEALVRMLLAAVENGEELFSLLAQLRSAGKEVSSILQENGYHSPHLFAASLTAAKGDEEIAFAISDALERGNLLIVEGDQEMEELHGIKIESGYSNAHFVAHSGRPFFDWEEVDIFLCKKPIHSIQLALTILSESKKRENHTLIIGEEFSKDVMATLLLNHLRGFAPLCLVQSSFAKNLLSFEENSDASLESCAVIGRADRVIVTDQSTVIASSELEHDRITLLYTNQELMPLFKRTEKATLLSKEGVVAGGGFAYIEPFKRLQKFREKGAQILAHALLAPSIQLIKNVGLDPLILLEEISESPKGYGYNLFTQQIEHLGRAGVIDPLPLALGVVEKAIDTAEEIMTTNLLLYKST